MKRERALAFLDEEDGGAARAAAAGEAPVSGRPNDGKALFGREYTEKTRTRVVIDGKTKHA